MTRGCCRAAMAIGAVLVPRRDRDRWRAEWRGEIDHSWSGSVRPAQRLALTMRACGAIAHAAWLRKEDVDMDNVRQDVRAALRLFTRQPGFAAVAVLTLALGVGANAAIFSVVNATLIAPLPFGHPEELFQIWESIPSQGVTENTPAPDTFDTWRSGSRTLVDMAAYTTGTGNITGSEEPERLLILRTSANLVRLLQARLTAGRGFTPDEDRFGGPGAILLSDRLWTRRFRRDPHIVGESVIVDGIARTVVGVLPPELPVDVANIDAWVPLALGPKEPRQSRMLWVVGRGRPGGSAAAVARDLDGVMHAAGPSALPAGIGVTVDPIDDALRGGVRPDLLMVFAVSGVVLIVACTNVATMLLARGLSRQREMAVRSALGANRARLARMMTVESLVLGGAGAVTGVLIAAPALRIIQSMMPVALAATVTGAIDLRVLAFAVVVSVVSAVAFGIVPVAGVMSGPLTVSTRTSDGVERGLVRHGRHALVVAELGLAVVLLTGAAILITSFVRLVGTPVGFRSANVLTAQIDRNDPDADKRTQFYSTLIENLAHSPGVRAVGITNGLPVRFTGGGSGFRLENGSTPPTFVNGHHRIVSGGYFTAMAIPVLRGQVFTGSENPAQEFVTVVSESFAAQAWPGANPIGQRLQWGGDGPYFRVIGVVADVRLARSLAPEPHVYFPFTQVRTAFVPSDIAILTTGPAAAIAPTLRDVVRHIDPNQPVASVLTMDDLLDRSMGRRRFTLTLMTTFAGVALVLAAIGVYGVLSYTVRRRRQEIAVRMALGATAAMIRRDVLRRGLVLAALGSAVGGAAAIALARWAGSLVPGLGVPDRGPMAAAIAILLVVAAAACDIPARRATHVDPLTALRGE